jgi:hypothetical protein
VYTANDISPGRKTMVETPMRDKIGQIGAKKRAEDTSTL